MIRQRKKVLGHAEDYSKLEWAEPHPQEIGWREKKPKQPTKEEQKMRLLFETQSPTSFQTATTDLAGDSVIKQLNFFLYSSCCLGCIKPHKSWMNWYYFCVVVFDLWTNSTYFRVVGELAAVKKLYFGVGTVELPSEQWAELGQKRALNW